MSIYYQDEHVTLYHGDCLEHTAWLEADVLVTDPPYGIGWKQPDLPASMGSGRAKHGSFHKHVGILNDDNTEARDKVLHAWGEDKPAIVFAGWQKPITRNVRQTLIWKKPSNIGVIGAKYGYRRDTEAIYLLGRHQQRTVARSSVLETSGSNTNYQDGTHPHMKPISLMEQLMEWTDGVIADPFAGSGSTLVAARNLGRRAIGVELEEKYCEIIANRLSQGAFDFA